MKKILILLTIIASYGQVFAQDCNDIPKLIPGVYIQDHANKLTPNEERALETKIQNYRQKTGIQICIATVDNIGDFDVKEYTRVMGNCYGVGEKDVNNGVIILFSWDRNWAIQTGYATESYITDYEVDNMGEKYVKPNLPLDKNYEAANSVLDACIREMGWETWPERIAAKQKAEQEAAQQMRNFWMWAGCFVGLILLLWLAIWIYRREQKRQKIRKQLSVWKKQIKDGRPGLNTAGWPNWAKKEYEQIVQQFQGAESQFEHEEGGIFAAIDDPDQAYELMNAMESGCIAILNRLIEQTNALPGRIQQYQANAVPKVKSMLATVQDFQNGVFATATKQGFKFVQWGQEVGRHLSELRKWEAQLQSPQPDHYKAAFETASELEKTFAVITAAFAALMANYETINKETKAWTGRIAKIRSNNTTAGILSQLQSDYANNVWQELKKQFDVWQSQLATAEKNLQTAASKNSLQQQDFSGAWSDYQAATTAIAAIENLFTCITQTLEQQKSCQSAYSSKQSVANSAISTARSKCSDSDVESRAKGYLSEAEGLYRSATNAASGKTDWVIICGQLDNAKKKADEAYAQACRDISDAEEERAAARRRAAAAAAEATRRNSSPIGGGGGGGNNFGGGSFGGGGGGGKW